MCRRYWWVCLCESERKLIIIRNCIYLVHELYLYENCICLYFTETNKESVYSYVIFSSCFNFLLTFCSCIQYFLLALIFPVLTQLEINKIRIQTQLPPLEITSRRVSTLYETSSGAVDCSTICRRI